MNINRYNYEEYFLLYTDNELNAMEREAVEQFVEKNPDLEEELIMLQHSTFTPEKDVVFDNKAALMHFTSAKNFIHSNNCEELFILYADDELTNAEKAAVEQFVYDHPQYKGSFQLIQSLKLTPDASVTFAGKQILYRHQKEVKRITFSWRVAAAAVILIFTGILGLNNQSPSVSQKNARKIDKTTQKKFTQSKTNPPGTKENLPLNEHDLTKSVAVKINKTNVTEKALAGKYPVRHFKPQKNADDPRVSSHIARADLKKSVLKPGGTIHPESENNYITPYKISETGEKPQIAIDEEPVLTVGDYKINKQNVLPVSEVNTENVMLASTTVDKKSTLRGFFRKASRLIDKTTSSNSSKRSGINIGNIEIAFQ